MSSEWREGQLRDFALINPKTEPLNPESPFITMSAVPAWGQWAYPDTTKGTKGGVRAQGGDVLVARITPCLENGKIAKVPSDFGAVGGSTEFIVLRGSQLVLSDYLFLWASERATHAAAVNLMTGSTGRQRVSASDYGALPLLLPPIEEQRRIVDLLGAIDDVIEKAGAVQVDRTSARNAIAGQAFAMALHNLRAELLSSLISGAHRIPETYDELMGA